MFSFALASLGACGAASDEHGETTTGPSRGLEKAGAPAPRSTDDAAMTTLDLPFTPSLRAYVAMPQDGARKHRLITHLHGMCSPPSQACARFAPAATRAGLLVCPPGDGTCGGADNAAPTWDHPADTERVNGHVELALATVAGTLPGALKSDGAILSGFSLGALLAWELARTHPGRWSYLILGGATVRLSAGELRAAKVRAVAFLAGEADPELAGMRLREGKLRAVGYPAKLWMMAKVGHDYPPDIDKIMGEAITFVLEH